VGVFVRDGISISGRLELMHDIQTYPGGPGRSRDRLVTFANLGDVVGTEITVVALKSEKLTLTADIVVPGSIAWVQQLIDEEPLATTMGPLNTIDANNRATKTIGVG
jgi:hypothetical protein